MKRSVMFELVIGHREYLVFLLIYKNFKRGFLHDSKRTDMHHGWNFKDILNVPLRNILGPSFWFIFNFTDWEHWDRTAWNTVKEILNEPPGEILGTFFRKIVNVLMVFLMGTSWSHDLEHCECTHCINIT